MNKRSLLSIVAVLVAGLILITGNANAQQLAEIDAVKAAHASFLTALSSRDAKAMEDVWAKKPYVVNIGPRSKAPAVGYADAVADYWPRTFKRFSEINVRALSITQIRTDGKLASVVGMEGVVGKTKSGKTVDSKLFVTNIFEKDGNRWLLVSHHAQRIPK
jgi:ketosteroid isomerase-like protein